MTEAVETLGSLLGTGAVIAVFVYAMVRNARRRAAMTPEQRAIEDLQRKQRRLERKQRRHEAWH